MRNELIVYLHKKELPKGIRFFEDSGMRIFSGHDKMGNLTNQYLIRLLKDPDKSYTVVIDYKDVVNLNNQELFALLRNKLKIAIEELSR